MQSSTSETAEAIRKFITTIGSVSDIAAEIAAAVENQGLMTREIATNVEQAAIGTADVAANIADVTHGSVASRRRKFCSPHNHFPARAIN